MLLRRLMNHLNAQNWLAVVLDLLIVIVGVFLGFQVNAWNEGRKSEAAEYAALIRLHSEAEQVVAYWQFEVQREKELNENRLVLLEVLKSGEMAQDQTSSFDDAVMRLGHYPHFNPPRTVYDELIAAGGLRTISDAQVRHSVADYATELDFASGQLAQFRTNLPTLYAAYQGRIFSTYEPERSSKRRFEYDIPALAKDRQFVSDVVDAVRNQLQFLTFRESVLRRAIKMCESVSRAIASTCNPVEFSEEEIQLWDGVNQ